MGVSASIRQSIRRSIRSSIGVDTTLLDTALVNLTTEGIQTTGGAVTSWENSGTGGSAYDLDVVLGTGANLRELQDKAITFYGADGDRVTTPANAAVDAITSGDMEIICYDQTLIDWTPAADEQAFVSQWDGAGTDRKFIFRNKTNGRLELFLGHSGGQLIFGFDAHGYLDGSTHSFRVEIENNGASGFACEAFDVDTGLSLGTASNATVASLNVSAADIVVGAFDDSGTGDNLVGSSGRVEIYSGLVKNGGTLALNCDASQAGNKTGVASDTFISGGVTFTMHGDTFANNTGHSIVNSSGGAGLESTAGQTINTPMTIFLVAKAHELTGTAQFFMSARLASSLSPQIIVDAGDNFRFDAGAGIVAGAADLALHIHTASHNGDPSTNYEASGIGSVTGNAGSEALQYGTIFASPAAASTLNGSEAQLVIFDRALNVSEKLRVQSELNRRYKGIST